MKEFFKKIKKFSKENKYFNPILIALLILIPMFFSIWFRAYPAFLPITEEWSENNVVSYYKNQIALSVNAQFPNLPDVRKTELINQQYEMFLQTNGDQMKSQIEDNAKYIKSKFQDDSNSTYLLEIDPYHYYRYVRNYFETGVVYDELNDGKTMDNHMLYPIGVVMPPKHLHIWLAIFVYKIADLFGNFELMHIFFWLPLLIAPLAVIPAFFIAKMIGGKIAGFFSAMLIAVHTSFLSRTVVGFSDTDSYNVVFPLFIAWFFLESLNAKKKSWKAIFASLSAVFVGLFYFAWGGWWYSFAIMIATIFGVLIYQFIFDFIRTKKYDNLKNTLFSGGIFFGISAVLITIFSGSIKTVFSFITGPLGFLSLKDVGGTKIWPNVFTTVAELNEASILNIINSMYGQLFFFIALTGITLSIIFKNFEASKEKRNIALWFIILTIFWNAILVFRFNNINQILFLFFMAIPPIVAIILDLIFNLEMDINSALLLIIWFVVVMFASYKGIRFTLVLVPAFCIAFGIAVGIIVKLLSRLSEKSLGVDRNLSLIVLLVLSLFLFNTPIKQADALARNEIPLMNDEWYNTLLEINDKAADFAVINSWWDYGHWFKTIGNRPVTFDGATQNSPQAHWIGKVLLTDNEKEALGILRMLDCGGNKAFENIEFILNDSLNAKLLLDRIVLAESRIDAENILKENISDITDEELKSILDNTHCENLPENYLITSDDMVGKSGVWAHFGDWNFTKSTMVNIVSNNQRKREPSVNALMSRFNLNRTIAEDYYYQIIGNDPDQWIAEWPGYVSSMSSCSVNNDLLVCQNGLVFNVTSQKPYLMTQQGEVSPESLTYVDNEGNFIVEKYYNNTIPYSAAIIRTSSGMQSFLMSPKLAGSMFTRMYFYKDSTLEHFNIFSTKTQITGGDILVWKVNWDGKGEDNMANTTNDNSSNPIVLVETNMGEIEIELFEKDAPITVENFLKLSEEGFYDKVLFHRVIDGFMIQSGDPNTKGNNTGIYGTGGPGYTIEDESNSYTFNQKGILAMANAGPNTGGSQFFITVAQTPWLNGKHTIFGRVTKGYDVVEKISLVEVNEDDLPLDKVYINSIKLLN